jgi:hypothetical protein
MCGFWAGYEGQNPHINLGTPAARAAGRALLYADTVRPDAGPQLALA